MAKCFTSTDLKARRLIDNKGNSPKILQNFELVVFHNTIKHSKKKDKLVVFHNTTKYSTT